ncbi:MAG: polysaccharide biosynthesis protein [Clostridiales bacterium]|jgi:stage V sporulation protein B|nr:polysaccharide biosynthesis protein [Clostridiales bacterium]
MKQRDFFKSASILALAGFITKVIGALYRIPLTNIVGAEAIGVYQLIFSVYALFLTSSAGGLPAGLSKLVAEEKALGGGQTGRIVGGSMGFVGLTGLFFAAVLIFFARPLAAVQGNPDVAFGYIVIAPAIFFVGITSVFRGYFQGNLDMMPTAASQIIEQIVKLTAGLIFASVLIKKGVLYGAAGAVLGVVVSELLAAVYLCVLFRRRGGRLIPASGFKEMRSVFKKVAKYSIPITVGGVLMPLTQFADSFLVVNILNKTGLALNVSTSLYGILTGPVSSLINLPVVMTIALAVVIIPVVSRQKTRGNIREILAKSNFAIKVALFIGVPAAILFAALSSEIMSVLYPNFSAFELAAASRLLAISAIGIIFLAATQIFTALLQALDKPFLPVGNMAFALLLKIVLNIVLIKPIGIYGAAVSTAAAYFTAAALNFISLGRLIGVNRNIPLAVLKTAAAGACMAGFIFLTKNAAENLYLKLFLTAFIAAAAYMLISLFISLFTDDELASLPLGRKLIKLKGGR